MLNLTSLKISRPPTRLSSKNCARLTPATSREHKPHMKRPRRSMSLRSRLSRTSSIRQSSKRSPPKTASRLGWLSSLVASLRRPSKLASSARQQRRKRKTILIDSKRPRHKLQTVKSRPQKLAAISKRQRSILQSPRSERTLRRSLFKQQRRSSRTLMSRSKKLNVRSMNSSLNWTCK